MFICGRRCRLMFVGCLHAPCMSPLDREVPDCEAMLVVSTLYTLLQRRTLSLHVFRQMRLMRSTRTVWTAKLSHLTDTPCWWICQMRKKASSNLQLLGGSWGTNWNNTPIGTTHQLVATTRPSPHFNCFVLVSEHIYGYLNVATTCQLFAMLIAMSELIVCIEVMPLQQTGLYAILKDPWS